MREYEEDFGTLSFGMEKTEAINLIEKLFTMPKEIKSFSDILKILAKDSSYNSLTQLNIKEILDYAIEKELIKPYYDEYMRTY